MIPAPEIGHRFGRLVVVTNGEMKGNARAAMTQCDCGAMVKVSLSSLRRGDTKSCGCFRRDCSRAATTKHGCASTPEHATWLGMIGRCSVLRDTAFAMYGGRGIKVCDEWQHDFPAFLAYIGPKPTPKHTIDRIDNAKGYEPGNVRWATREEQNRNRSSNRVLTHNGASRCLAEWAAVTGMKRETIAKRLLSGWSVADTLTRPVHVKAGQQETA